MRSIGLFFLMELIGTPASAQIPIPDANLRFALNDQVPGCITGNNLDMFHPGVLSATSLDISSYGIQNLTGVGFFPNVVNFIASNNPLGIVDDVPPNAEYVQLDNCQLTSINVPITVRYLRVANNLLTTLNLGNYTDLQSLNCSYNQLTSLTNLSFYTVTDLNCSHNLLTTVDVPYYAIYTDVSHNLLTEVPSATGALIAHHNLIDTLLWTNADQLDVSHNLLVHVQMTGVAPYNLNVSNNPLPNGIGDLPVALTTLVANNTGMACLPYLPMNLTTLQCTGNTFTCLPNQPPNLLMSAANFGFPPALCTSTNPCFLPLPTVQLRVFLEGPYNSVTGMMNDALRTQGLIPATEPYTALGFAYSGQGWPDAFAPAVLSVTGPDAIVDWVVVDVYPNTTIPYDGNAVHYSRPALLQRDGDVVNLDGTWPLLLNMNHGNYRLAIRHRNHLGAITKFGDWYDEGTQVVDFTDWFATICWPFAMKGETTERQLWAGDVTFNHVVSYSGTANDRDPILLQIGGTIPTATTTGYRQEDVNMDGVVKYSGANNDRDRILQNIGGVVPTNTRNQIGFQ